MYFDRYDEPALDVAATARHECLRSGHDVVQPVHILLAVVRDSSNLGAKALAMTNIRIDTLVQECERSFRGSGEEKRPAHLIEYERITFNDAAKRIFNGAQDFRRYLGRSRVSPEHILLALLDTDDETILHILEELGANLTFLRRQVMSMVAASDCLSDTVPGLRETIIAGLDELVADKVDQLEQIKTMANLAGVHLPHLPERARLVHVMFMAYLPEFLLVQVGYQRYLLEETIRLLTRRTGPLAKEDLASIVSVAAQNMRDNVRATIEYVCTHEGGGQVSMPDEAELDSIGSVAEDLWWTHSEEIALHDVFDEALDDYRRKHMLNLQKRRLEISLRLTKIRSRLQEVLRQSFLKRSFSQN